MHVPRYVHVEQTMRTDLGTCTYQNRPYISMNIVRAWYVRLKDWNVLHVPRVLLFAPIERGFLVYWFCAANPNYWLNAHKVTHCGKFRIIQSILDLKRFDFGPLYHLLSNFA